MGLVILGLLVMLTPFGLSTHDVVISTGSGAAPVLLDVLNVKIKLVIVGAALVVGGLTNIAASRRLPSTRPQDAATHRHTDWRNVGTDFARFVGGVVVFWAVLEMT